MDNIKVNLYTKERGAICYEFNLFWRHEEGGYQAQRPAELLASGLAWYWTSVRTQPVAENSPVRDLPDVRPLTRLTADLADDLLSDFRETNIEGVGRHIFILGLDSGSETALLTPDGLRRSLQDFESSEAGPLRIIIFNENDMTPQYVHVPHKPIDPVVKLLMSWGVKPGVIAGRHRGGDKGLGVIKLENLIDGIVEIAMGRPWGS